MQCLFGLSVSENLQGSSPPIQRSLHIYKHSPGPTAVTLAWSSNQTPRDKKIQTPAQMDLPIRVRGETGHPPMTGKTKGKKKGGKKNVQDEWEKYFGTDDNNLAKWQQLGQDLGIPEGKLTGKTQIRKVSVLTRTSLDDGHSPVGRPSTDVAWLDLNTGAEGNLGQHQRFPLPCQEQAR